MRTITWEQAFDTLCELMSEGMMLTSTRARCMRLARIVARAKRMSIEDILIAAS